MKTCSICQAEFEPKRMGQMECSLKCAKSAIKPNKAKQKALCKPKKPKLSTLIDKADRAMSVYIRLKSSDEHGYAPCISCGRIFRWEEMDNGHFISRRHFSTRYVEENCHAECRYCNRFNGDHLIGYTTAMIDLYGKEGVKELQEQSKRTLTPSEKRKIVEEALEYYTKALEGLVK